MPERGSGSRAARPLLGWTYPTAQVIRAWAARLNELGKYLRDVVDYWSKVPVQ